MSAIRNICVYCGSSAGSDARFADAADALGRALAAEGVGLIYGGGGEGLMGRLARSTLAAGGYVTGDHPKLPHPQGTCPDRGPRDDCRRGHARPQAGNVRSRRRLRCAAGWGRHARGAGRADDLGAAQSAHEAHPHRQYRRLLAAFARALRPYAYRRLHSRRLRYALSRRRGSRTCCRCCAPPPSGGRPTADRWTPSLLATYNGEAPQRDIRS